MLRKVEYYQEKQKFAIKNNDFLELNVGGVSDGFTISKKLLHKVRGSKLEGLCGCHHDHETDTINGRIFIDRDS